MAAAKDHTQHLKHVKDAHYNHLSEALQQAYYDGNQSARINPQNPWGPPISLQTPGYYWDWKQPLILLPTGNSSFSPEYQTLAELETNRTGFRNPPLNFVNATAKKGWWYKIHKLASIRDKKYPAQVTLTKDPENPTIKGTVAFLEPGTRLWIPHAPR